MMTCNGRGSRGDHCCYVAGKVCRFLVDGEMPRCGLKMELGDWEKVHNDPRYLEHVRPNWDEAGVSDCGEFGTGRDGKPKACCFAGSNEWQR